MKSNFTYRTETSRIKALKVYALEHDINVNEVLDKLVDGYLKGVEANEKE